VPFSSGAAVGSCLNTVATEMPVIVRRHFRRVLIELLVWTVVFVFAFASAMFTESFYEPQWQGRARWSTWPVVLLAPWPMIRLLRLLFSRWAIHIDGDRLETRASMWRDFSYRFSEVRRVVPIEQGRFRYTKVELIDGRSHGVTDRYLDMSNNFDLVAMLKGDQSDRTQ
jgi:hypothetical protein